MFREFYKKYQIVALSFFIGGIILFLDFLSKAYIYHLMPYLEEMGLGLPIFKNFLGGIDFTLSLTFNRGAAWGFFAGLQLPLLILRIVVILGMLIYLIFFNKERKMVFPFVIVIAGALGNIVDFFLYGSVVDFLLFTFWGWPFPLFNFADTAITLGMIALFLIASFSRKKRSSLLS